MADDFDSAFAKAIKEDVAAAPPIVAVPAAPAPAPIAPVPVDSTKTVAPVVQTAPASGVAPASVDTTPTEPEGIEHTEPKAPVAAAEPEPPKSPQAPEPAAPQADDDLLKRFAALMQQAQPVTVTPEAPREPPAPASPAPPTQPPALFTQEEMTQLSQFYTDWPDVARAAEIMARGMVVQAMRNMYADIASSLAPYLQRIDAVADHTQLSELQSKVPDYDDLVDKVTEWVGKQPAYLRPAYEHVIQQGTTAEVVDLIDRYRRDNGGSGQAQAPIANGKSNGAAPPATSQPAAVPALSPAAKQAAAKLAPVSTIRGPTTAGAPTDFDAAFAEFAKTM